MNRDPGLIRLGPWAPPPAAPRLVGSDVHLWWTTLDPLDRAPDAVLSPAERDRASRLRNPPDRERFVRGRALLRTLLARYTGTPPERVPLVTGAHGRPELSPDVPLPRPLHFNLSHTPHLLLLAVGTAPVGVDLEEEPAPPELDALATSSLSPRERALLERSPPPERGRAYLQAWTLKEAFLKGLGLGLALPPDRVCVADPSAPRLLDPVPTLPPGATDGWRVLALDTPPPPPGRPGRLAALAVHGTVAAVHRFRLTREAGVAEPDAPAPLPPHPPPA